MKTYKITYNKGSKKVTTRRTAENATAAIEKLCNQYGWGYSLAMYDADTRGDKWAEYRVDPNGGKDYSFILIGEVVNTMDNYYINFGTGAGDLYAATLSEAKAIADDRACYTQQDIVIKDCNGDEVCRRIWWGVKPDEDAGEDIIEIGGGYYDEWQDA